MATQYVSETAAGKSLSAWVILDKKGQHVATVRAHWSNSGACLVNVFDDKAGFQHARATGYGYDKLTSALSGLMIDGHALSDHCRSKDAPKLPKGCHLYPRDFKAPKGYSLVNFTSVSRATGTRFYQDHWINLATQQVGEGRHEEIARVADELRQAWEVSDDCERGYSSCYRESGLDYLKALGYRVMQAI